MRHFYFDWSFIPIICPSKHSYFSLFPYSPLLVCFFLPFPFFPTCLDLDFITFFLYTFLLSPCGSSAPFASSINQFWMWWHQLGGANNLINIGDDWSQHGTATVANEITANQVFWLTETKKRGVETLLPSLQLVLDPFCLLHIFSCRYRFRIGQRLNSAHKLHFLMGIQNTSSTVLLSVWINTCFHQYQMGLWEVVFFSTPVVTIFSMPSPWDKHGDWTGGPLIRPLPARHTNLPQLSSHLCLFIYLFF